MPWFYHVARAIVRMLLLLTRWRVRGKENIPSQGPLLIVANHLSMVDPPILNVSLNRRVIFMAKKELFQSKVIGYLVRSFGAFPVHRGQLDREALRQAYKVLDDGLALVMFPEGMRSHSQRLRSAFSGSALIASRSGAPILPVGITGTEKTKSKTWVFRRPRITINIGRPFDLPPVSGRLSRAELVERTNSIMGHIAELLPSEYRGEYTGKDTR